MQAAPSVTRRTLTRRSVRMLPASKCAFVTFAARDMAEKARALRFRYCAAVASPHAPQAAATLELSCMVKGVRAKLAWAKPHSSSGGQSSSSSAAADAAGSNATAPAAAAAAHPFLPPPAAAGKSAYPSMDPSFMGGSRRQ